MRRLLLLVTIAGLLATGSAQDAADGQDTTESGSVPPTPTFSVLRNTTITCSARLPAAVVGCYVERPLLVLGPVELAIGVDAQAALRSDHGTHLAPYVVAAAYLDTWSAWIELRLPELAGLHPLGDPDYLRFGLSYRFQ